MKPLLLLRCLLFVGLIQVVTPEPTTFQPARTILEENLADVEVLGILQGSDDTIVQDIAFSPDGTVLATIITSEIPLGDFESCVQFWDVRSLAEVSILKPDDTEATSVVFSNDGELLATGDQKGTVKLWNVETGEIEATLQSDTAAINAVAFNPGDLLLAAASGQQEGEASEYAFRLFDLTTGQDLISWPLNGDTYAGTGLSTAFSPDGQLVAFGQTNGVIQIWDIDTQTRIAVLEGHTFWVYSVMFSSDSSLLVSGSGNGEVILWNMETFTREAAFDGGMEWNSEVVFSPDGLLVATSGADGNVYLWSSQTQANLAVLEGLTDRVVSLAFSPDGTLLASGGADGTVRLWGVREG